MTNIHIPIARRKDTKELANVKDVPNGLECNCYCDKCKESVIAVNREVKQKAHFRHNKDSNCEFSKNYESYIHWLTKEVFKSIGAIYLPKIYTNNLGIDSRGILSQKFSEFYKSNEILYKNYRQFDDFEDNTLSYKSQLLQDVKMIEIEKCYSEKVYKSEFGDIKVDLVLVSENTKLFIEPYYTHKIDSDKLKRIANIDISTISIDLLKFVDVHEYLFTIEEFKNFLTNDLGSKKWEYIRKSKTINLISKLFAGIKAGRVEALIETLKSNEILHKRIIENLEKIEVLSIENEELSKKIKDINIYDLFKD